MRRGMARAHELENQNVFVTVTLLSITSRLYPARPALMSRLNPPIFRVVGGPLRPCILKQAEFEIAALQTGSPCDPRQQFSNARRPI